MSVILWWYVIFHLQGKLELITGVFSDNMKLDVYDSLGGEVCSLNDDAATLDSFPIANGMRLHVSIGSVHTTHMCYYIHNCISGKFHDIVLSNSNRSRIRGGTTQCWVIGQRHVITLVTAPHLFAFSLSILISLCLAVMYCIWCAQVTDTSGGAKKSEFEDVSQVQKYEMSREDYEKKTGRDKMIGCCTLVQLLQL